MIRQTLKDSALLLSDAVKYVFQPGWPRFFVSRAANIPAYLRAQHLLLWANRLDLSPAERKEFENIVKGRTTGTEMLPVCQSCGTTFQPFFISEDGVVSTKKRCVGCVRAESEKSCSM